MKKKSKKYKEGTFLVFGVMFGMIIGTIIGVTTKKMGLIGIGLPIGIAIGIGLEEKYKKEGKTIQNKK